MFQTLLFDTFGPGQLLSPVYLVPMAVIAWAIFRWRGNRSGFRAWLLPGAIWRHRSIGVDVWLFIIGRAMAALGVLALIAAVPAVATWVAGHLPWQGRSATDFSPLALGFIFWVFGDFAVYFNHRAQHQISALWPLHAVHHSAAVLTPLTAYRQHPFSILFGNAIQTMVLGIILGVLVGTLAPDTTTLEIAGVNAFTVLAIMAMANFHHSHIWISYGPILERVLISPAQHQVHHSTNPAHYNKNFGNTLAIWDWMFGTLYVPRAEEKITFGLTAEADAPLMTQRILPILVDPVRRMLLPRRD